VLPRNTLVFLVPGHGTWTFKQERGRKTLKELDASQSLDQLRLLTLKAMAPLPRDREQSDAA
jgi:hypothetical protein